ncbi:hypothetical protein [Romboutsia sp.]|uniref:hypothetical protein n=1 Tax=Romboutsia sp. TaxID=1965302 RepID=UPI003F33FD2D
MSKYQDQGCNCSGQNTIAHGNSIELEVNSCESEIRSDIVVSEFKSVRLWGQILNCDKKPVANALIKLLRVICNGCSVDYEGVAHTVSDCNGFYQFELCADSDIEIDKDCYKIIVSKSAYGIERIIPVDGGNCDPCNSHDEVDPCKPYKPMITPPSNCSTGWGVNTGCTCSNCNSSFDC